MPPIPPPDPVWIATATDVQLALAHRDHNRWLNLPGSELWAEQYAEREAEMAAIWAEMKRREAEHRASILSCEIEKDIAA